MKKQISMGFENTHSFNLEPTTRQLRTFNELIERVPLLGEHIRFNGRDRKVPTVISDLDSGVIHVGISDPL